MNRLLLALAFLGSVVGFVIVHGQAPKTLDFYTIDVEGGKAVLIVSPSGESMLFDVGWPASSTREASTDQILSVAAKAGLKQLDYLVLSHFDVDHMGDVPALASRIPIRHVIDHGEIQVPAGGNPSAFDRFKPYAAFRQRVDHRVVKPGDRIPLKDVTVEVVTAGGKRLRAPLKGAGAANPLCAENPQAEVIERDVEDNQSIGLLFTFGSFRLLDLADLEAHHNHDLVCPANLIGHVDVYHVNVHGQFKGMARELVGALRPTVAIMGNGARKGGDPPTWPILSGVPGLADIWQVHYSEAGTADTNPPLDFVANLQGPLDDHQLIKLSVRTDGTYTLTNTRNGFSRTYHTQASTVR
jgi:beta-lactamase superfamily II metal-dependent hydrolase